MILAPSRARRPNEFKSPSETAGEVRERDPGCPFCPGNESRTPPEIYSERAVGPAGGSWSVRVVPNKFPALQIEEDNRRYDQGEGFRFIGGCGAHEVIVESPHHSQSLSDQSVDQVQRILRTAQMRSQDLMRDPRFQVVTIFKNHGAGAGTSLAHPHWQMIATPVVPRMLRLKQCVAADYFDLTGCSLYRLMLQDELARKTRIVAVNDHFAVLLPYASHLPFETWILPLQHQSSFCLVEPQRLWSLAAILQLALQRLNRALDNPAFNLTIDSAPRGNEFQECFSWHIRILPRLTTPAGFELGSGMSINTVLPEEAAGYLRSIEP